MHKSVGDIVCHDGERAIHEDLEVEDIEVGGIHKGCGNQVAVWSHANRDIKKTAKKLGVTWEYTVAVTLGNNKSFAFTRWAETY